MAKFKVGDKVVKTNGSRWCTNNDYAIIEKVRKHDSGYSDYQISESVCYWNDKELELYKEDKEMKGLTFREVIANIKEGEVWECGDLNITKTFAGLYIGNSEYCFGFLSTQTFVLKRKEYTFEEAFKTYEEGKEIESKSWRYKKIDGKDSICSKDNDEWVTSKLAAIDIKEIRGKWYIND